MITLQSHNDITVLRDDLLPGGTKSVLMPSIVGAALEYVYASPVYGGFQIALAEYCKQVGKRATIFCAQRKTEHANTLKCRTLGAKIVTVPFGYLNVVEKRARDYCKLTGAVKIDFGAGTHENRLVLESRVRDVISQIGKEPEEIFCAIGSGTLVESILMATKHSKVVGVSVGMNYTKKHERLRVLKYHATFAQESKYHAPFPSMPNYDLKAWEYCNLYHTSQNPLFWNVL